MSDPNRRAWLDLDAIKHNLNLIKDHFAPDKKVIAYVKAQGYGHGVSEQFVQALSAVDAFAVACLDEASKLRQLTDKIILFNSAYLSVHTFAAAKKIDVDVVVHDCFPEYEAVLSKLPRLWLKVNTSMNRMGVSIEQAHHILQSFPEKEVILMTHLADSKSFSAGNEKQLERLKSMAEAYPNVQLSFANSARILGDQDFLGDWVRPGLLLYGAMPYRISQSDHVYFRPALTFKARVIAHQRIAAGESIGYDRHYIAKEAIDIAILSAGYADGYPRVHPRQTPVLYQNTTYFIVGRVSMDTLQIAANKTAPPPVGAWVTLWGEGLPIEAVAAACDTSPYELMVNLSLRVDRVLSCHQEEIE